MAHFKKKIVCLSRIFGSFQTGHEEDDAEDVLPHRGGKPRAGDRLEAEEEQDAVQKELRLSRGKILYLVDGYRERSFCITHCTQCDQLVSLFFNIWPFATMKISPIISQICQSRLSIMPNMN